MSGGEKLGGGETDARGELGRDGARGIGARVLEAQNELVGGGDNLTEGENESPERLRRLNEAVFENVDLSAVLERTMEAAERIDLGKLAELRDKLAENPEIGMIDAENYFAEVLDLSVRPYLDIDRELDKGTLGSCANGREYPDHVSVDMAQHHGDTDSALETLGHENWHSYQHDVIRRVKKAEKEGYEISEEMKELAQLYEYNDKAYIQSDLDFEGYRKQLYEVEAETFETLIRVKIGIIKGKEQAKINFMAERPEVYGEENREGIEREVDGVLHGIDMGEFLHKAGVESFDELWQVGEDEQVTQGYAAALSDLVGLEQPMVVGFVDELENDKRARLSYKTGEVTISRKRMWNFQPLTKLPEIAWKMRQREVARNAPESERGKLYRTNLGAYVQDNHKMHEAYKRQLLVRESDYFQEEWLNVLDEQAMLEEIEMMSPEERAEAMKEMKEKEWRPVVSEKYEVKGK